MDCGSLTRKIDEFRDGALSEDESSEIRKHVASCRQCRDLLSSSEEFDKKLQSAFASIMPPSDFAARTARAVDELKIQPASKRPVLWVASAAAACLLLAIGLDEILPDPSARRRADGIAARAPSPSGQVRVGKAFTISKKGKRSLYRGRTGVRIIWNMREKAPELIVDAFPGAD